MTSAARNCSVSGCLREVGPKGAKGMCPKHYSQCQRTGQPVKHCPGCGKQLATALMWFCSDDCKPRCSVEGCDNPSRKRGWCASHYAQQQKTGRDPEPFKWKWYGDPCKPKQAKHSVAVALDREGLCKNCGETIGKSVRQQFCTHACYQAHRLYGGPRPMSTACVACGIAIDLMARGKKGQLRKSVVKFCRPCKRDYAKYKMSARELAQRDGTDCGICHQPIDMTLTRAAGGLDCPSVDHILPRAHGGSHEPANLQLAHLRCNMLKSDRIVVESGCK